AEAFAAARGAASPTQLRVRLKKDGRDLVSQFRGMAPHRRPISIQRVSFRRVGLIVLVLLVALLVFQNLVAVFRPTQNLTLGQSPECGTGNVALLIAQSVPSASAIPCIQG